MGRNAADGQASAFSEYEFIVPISCVSYSACSITMHRSRTTTFTLTPIAKPARSNHRPFKTSCGKC
jgi:hypothetical protein